MSDRQQCSSSETRIKAQIFRVETNQWSERKLVPSETSLVDFLATLENESNVRIFCNGKLAFTMYRNVKFPGRITFQQGGKADENEEDLS